MMDFNTFRQVVKDNILDFMGEEYKNCTIEESEYKKTNETIHYLSIKTGNSISPAIPLEKVYDDYSMYPLDGINTCLAGLSDAIIRGMERSKAVESALNNSKGYFVPCLVNTKANEELLAESPHREVADLSIIYREILFGEDGTSTFGSVRVSNARADSLHMTEEDLFEASKMCFDSDLYKINIASMNSVISTMFDPDIDAAEVSQDDVMFVATNRYGSWGANALLDEGAMERAKDIIGGDFYIIPSSIHELIFIKKDGADSEELKNFKDMVLFVNETQVEEKDRLSNNIYEYDSKSKTFKIAGDAVEKGIKDLDYKDPERNVTI